MLVWNSHVAKVSSRLISGLPIELHTLDNNELYFDHCLFFPPGDAKRKYDHLAVGRRWKRR